MVKVLIYSSKEKYDTSSYEGRAEAHLVAYKDGNEYVIMKNRTGEDFFSDRVSHYTLNFYIKQAERKEWKRELESHRLAEKYKTHPVIELMKNE